MEENQFYEPHLIDHDIINVRYKKSHLFQNLFIEISLT